MQLESVCVCYVIKDSTSVNDTMQNQFKKFKWVGVTSGT